MNIVNLKNGITIYLDPLPNTHSICLSLCVWAGPFFEKSGQNGISHLLEHLHFRALGEWTQRRLYFEMEKIGTTLRGTTFNNLLKFEVKVLPQYLLQALDILQKILNSTPWSEQDFKAEKAVVLNELSEKYQYDAGELALRQIFKTDTYAGPILGTEKTVNSLNLKDVLQYKKQVFSAGRVSLFVSGAFRAEGVLTPLTQKLGACPLPAPVAALKSKANFKSQRIKTVILPGEFTDAALSFVIPRGLAQKNQAELDLLQCILGEGVGSLLQRRVREELQLTNCIYTQLDYYLNCAVLQIDFSVQAERFWPCLQAVLWVLSGLKREVKSKELAAAVPFYAQNREFELDDPVDKNWQNIFACLVRKMERPLVLDYCGVTPEQICLLAAEIFQPQNLYLTVCGGQRLPQKSFEKQLQMLNK